MQKKIIALAIAAAFSAPAFADTANVTVYGDVKMAFEAVSVGDGSAGTPATAGYSANKISSNVTKLGFKGSEDLGGTLSAIWQIEQQIDADLAGGTFATRNTFVGLSDKAMGTVLMGKHDTPYKISTRSLDNFDSTIADNRSLMGGVGATFNAAGTSINNSPTAVASFDGRQGNVIAYISPAMSGLTVAVAYVAGAETANAGTVDKGSAVSMAAMYNMDALYASLAYERHSFGTNGSGTLAAPASFPAGGDLGGLSESAVKVGLGYKMDALSFGAEFERTNDDLNVGAPDTNALGHTAYALDAKYNLDANNAVKIQYSKAGKTNAADIAGLADGASQVSVGYDHSLSKTTSVFALYTAITNDDQGRYGLTTAGSTGGTGSVAEGAKVSALALGMKHAF